jgi:hypothetical protein
LQYEISFYLGKIDYDDAFGVHHWSTFCWEILSMADFSACKYGNDEDSNPETTPEAQQP